MGAAAGTLSDAQKVDVRRFCGYPAFGSGADGNVGWRFFQQYGAMEYRMNNLSVDEVAVVTNMLVTLVGFEASLQGSVNDLDTDAAGPWKRNKDEVRDRRGVLELWSRRLCDFMGIPPGPAMTMSGLQLIM
jgi:hypothetical protein